jgi:hypothetical protein
LPASRSRPALELVASRGRLDQPPDQPAAAKRERREHVRAKTTLHPGLGRGLVVRLLLRKTPNPSRHPNPPGMRLPHQRAQDALFVVELRDSRPGSDGHQNNLGYPQAMNAKPNGLRHIRHLVFIRDLLRERGGDLDRTARVRRSDQQGAGAAGRVSEARVRPRRHRRVALRRAPRPTHWDRKGEPRELSRGRLGQSAQTRATCRRSVSTRAANPPTATVGAIERNR